jgi:hypothetical protein
MVMYLGISLPVIGEGIAETRLGLHTAGIVFSLAVAAMAAIAFATLITARTGATRPDGVHRLRGRGRQHLRTPWGPAARPRRAAASEAGGRN